MAADVLLQLPGTGNVSAGCSERNNCMEIDYQHCSTHHGIPASLQAPGQSIQHLEQRAITKFQHHRNLVTVIY